MRAFDINWCPNEKATIEYILEYFHPEEIKDLLGIENYEKMNTDERQIALCDLFRHTPAKLEAFWKLPSEAELPEIFSKEDAEEFAWDWLEDEYGTAVDGFRLELDKDTILEKGVLTGVVYKRKEK